MQLRLSRLLAAALVAVVALTGHAAAQDGPASPAAWEAPAEIVDGATELLLIEMAILHELDAFVAQDGAVSTPDLLDEIHEAFAPWPRVGDVQLIAALDEVDGELAQKKGILLEAGVDLPAPVALRLDDLPENWLRRLADGETRFVPTGEYVAALDLLVHDGVPPPPGQRRPASDTAVADAIDRWAGPGVISNYTTADADDLPDRLALLSELSEGDDDGQGWLVVAGISLFGALVGGALVTWLLRRRNADDSDERVDPHSLDAMSRLAASYDEAEIAHIAIEVAVANSDARGGVLLRAAPDGLRIAGSMNVLGGSVLERVIGTGQPLITTVTTDPVVGHTPSALAAVPVVADGRVEGVLAVWREAGRPFDDRTRRRLEHVAPATGGALTSAEAYRSSRQLAMIDELTSLGNRRRLDGDLETTLAAAVRDGLPMAFAMIDIDHFKTFNDTHGHAAGDAALTRVARVIAECVRSSDLVYRYGGEEFSVLLPGATQAEAHAVVERVRAAVEAAPVPGEELQPDGRLTVSAGVATLRDPDGDGSPEGDIKERADAALYRAKSEGRNRVALA